MHSRFRCVLILLFLMMAELPAQTPDSPPKRLEFEVAAIHPAKPGLGGGMVKPMPNGTGYIVQNMTAKTLMAVMYRIPAQRIEGGPDWFGTETFDVEARADGSYSLDDLHTMFKNLLADRFGLKFHIETREGPVYNLVVAKGGLKMKPNGDKGDLNVPMIPNGPGVFVGTKVPMEYLCWFLGQQLGDNSRPVVDRTGLTQVYDFTLTFVPQFPGVPTDKLDPSLQNRPVLSDAVEDQLGLKLEPVRGPVQHYVLDNVSKPSEN